MIDYSNKYLYIIPSITIFLIIVIRIFFIKYTCIRCCKCVRRDKPLIDIDNNDDHGNKLINNDNTIFDRL